MTLTPLKDTSGRELCRGFLSSRVNQVTKQIVETRFAKLNDGSVLMSDERLISSDFNPAGSIWVKIDAMPDSAEFIGNYHVPKASQPFSSCRTQPINVLTVFIGFPLVSVGGKKELSEEYFDAVDACAKRAGLWLSTYDVGLMGGEPYAVWK